MGTVHELTQRDFAKRKAVEVFHYVAQGLDQHDLQVFAFLCEEVTFDEDAIDEADLEKKLRDIRYDNYGPASAIASQSPYVYREYVFGPEFYGIAQCQRIPISKSLRFDVLKRDDFTCQYCGRKAPDVVLHCDHKVPVSKGGPTTLQNLTTSCEDCNLGKRDKLLSDDIRASNRELDSEWNSRFCDGF
jgi:hypothetical protein